MVNDMDTPSEVIIAQERLRLIEQEVFRCEQEIIAQKIIVDDCDATRERLDNRLININSAYTYSQKLEKLLECTNRKKAALEKVLRLGNQVRQLREEREQIMAKIKSASDAAQRQPISRLPIINLYQETEQETVQYDVFISHATEDKESFVNALVEELKTRNVKVWVDALRIKWGDTLRKAIDDGLKKSRFGIVVISKHFIAKGWTQYELDGLFEREMAQGKVILPIWHNITKAEVQDFSPPLAARKALITSDMTPSDIADELVVLLKERQGQPNG